MEKCDGGTLTKYLKACDRKLRAHDKAARASVALTLACGVAAGLEVRAD